MTALDLTPHVLIRLPDAMPRLRDWLQRVRCRPLVPGQHDCCLFGAGAIEAQTGTDIAAPWRGRYRSFAGGRRLLVRAGYADHLALIAAWLPEVPVCDAVAGDIAIVPSELGPAVGVVQGAAVFVLHPAGGVGLCPMAPVIHLFKVG